MHIYMISIYKIHASSPHLAGYLNQMCLNSMAPLTLLSFLPCDDSESIARSYTQQRGDTDEIQAQVRHRCSIYMYIYIYIYGLRRDTEEINERGKQRKDRVLSSKH
jgi:hypothetical protein